MRDLNPELTPLFEICSLNAFSLVMAESISLTTNHAANGSVFLNLRNAGNFKIGPRVMADGIARRRGG